MGNEIGENGIYIFCTLPVKGVTYRQPHIFERPAGNRSIKRKDQSGCNNREETEQKPLRARCQYAESTECILLGTTS